MMLLSRSRSTERSVFSTGSRRWPSPGPSSISRSSPGASAPTRALLRRLALDELLADQRLRPDDALRVGAEVLVARVVDPQHDRGLEVRRDLDVLDRADLDAGDLHVLARDDEAGVVEDRAHAVGLVLLARRRGRAPPARRRAGRRRRGRRLSWPRRHLVGIAVEVPSTSRHGAEPSAFGCDAAPGQRRSWLVSSPSKRCDGGIGVSTPPAGLSLNVERVEDRLDARVVAVGVVVRRALAEVAQPAGELGRVRAQELEHRLRAPASASRPLSNAGVATRCSAGILRVASTRSLSGPVAAHERAQVADRRPRARRTSGRSSRRNGARSLRRRLGLGDEHVEVVERRAQVDERRVGAPQRRRQQAERARERDVLRADRARGRVRVADEAGEVVALLGQRRRPGARSRR